MIKTKYSKKMVDSTRYSVVPLINKAISDLESGVVFVPWTFSEHTEESLKEYNSFMGGYRTKHKYCPVCGSESCNVTLMGFPLYSGKEDEYKDLNTCTCINYGDRHVYHDRIEIKINMERTKKLIEDIENRWVGLGHPGKESMDNRINLDINRLNLYGKIQINSCSETEAFEELGKHRAQPLDPNIVEQIKNSEPFKFEDGKMFEYRMSQQEVKNILDSTSDIGDKHYALRNLFWGELQDYFNENDEIHMDCVSDALDNLLSNILEYLNNK